MPRRAAEYGAHRFPGTFQEHEQRLADTAASQKRQCKDLRDAGNFTIWGSDQK